ncbi:MAG: outer membrane beta-barrel protein [Candidatus Omnitrophica bacterium]|nr:outer membrane beta-barrel protein [Candidatus Omnitrophota bacterium]
MRRLKRIRCFILYTVFLGICLLASDNSDAFFFEDMDIKPRATLKQAFDDNVTFSNEKEKEDFVTTLSAGLDVGYEGKTRSFEITGDIKQQIYAQESEFNNISQALGMNFRKEFSKYDRIHVTNAFTHSEEPTSFEDAFGKTSGRYSYNRNIFNAEYIRDVSKHVSLQGRYGNESYRASRSDVRDSLSHSVGFDVNYIRSSATNYLFGYDFITHHIDDSGTATVHTVSTGFRHFLTKQLYADARAGVSFVDAFDESNTSEPNVIVAVTNDFNETDSASLSYRKTNMPSLYAVDIFDSWRVTASLSRQLLERLRTTVSVFFGEGNFEALSINDKQTGVNAQLSYDVSKDAVAFLSFIYSDIDSNINTRSYDRNLIEVGTRISF